MSSISFAPASALPLERLTAAFNLGFTGYYLPMEQTADSLARMIAENDVRLEQSLALFVDGQPAGIGLAALRGARGWIAGMGVGPAWRGQGYGERMLRHLLIRLSESGAREAQLEALEVNTPAVSLYQKLAFRTRRMLAVYNGPLRRDALRVAPGDQARVRAVPPRLALRDFEAYHSVAPAWQRERASLERITAPLAGLGLWEGGRLRAYLLYSRQESGYILLDGGSCAEDAETQRNDLARLLRALALAAPDAIFRVINAPPGDALGEALAALGCPVMLTQREMTRSLP